MKPLRVLLCVVLSMGVAAPGVAWASHTNNEPEQPGSVLVFPKFVRGTVPDGFAGGTLPKSEFEISVVCPTDLDCLAIDPLIFPDFPNVDLKGHWVCPGDDNDICRESDFTLSTTVNGTIRINPENFGDRTHNVAIPPCPEGYLILWVEGRVLDTNLLERIKFDGLIGDAILRHDATSAAAYNAVPIQAADGLPAGALTDTDFDGNLDFNGFEYNEVGTRIFGTVRYENGNATGFGTMSGGFDQTNSASTSLTLLTLDVASNRQNGRTFVDLNFFNEAERGVSTSTNFVCWQQVRLTQINEGLNTFFGTKGLVESGRAQQEDIEFLGEREVVTLLGIVVTTETIPGASPFLRSYAYSLYTDDDTTSTEFEPAGAEEGPPLPVSTGGLLEPLPGLLP